MNQWKKILIPIGLLFLSLLLDGTITFLFNDQLQTDFGFMVPRLFTLTIIMLAFYLEPRHSYILAIVFGFIYDSYYSGVLGVYIAVLTLVVYMILHLRKLFEPNAFVLALINIIMLTLIEFFVYSVYRVIDLTYYSVQDFMANRLGATLLFNTIAILLLSYPFNRLLEYIKNDEESKNKKITAL